MTIKLPKNLGVILLAGGMGTRMDSPVPKQFLLLEGKIIARYSFDLFLALPEIREIVVVCDPKYRHHFTLNNETPTSTPVLFALPGERRQDSVFNGLQQLSSELICIHDAARPLINNDLIRRTLIAATQHGAAAAGMPVKFTIKEIDSEGFVTKTPPRAHLWEIQTPQTITVDLLRQGFVLANKNKLTVTDDVSLIELLNHPVQIVEGSYSNLKITTPEDIPLAIKLLESQILHSDNS